MHKVIAAINSMISNQVLIEQIVENGNEFFFVYDKKFKWSISKDEKGEFYLHYYPGNLSIDEIASIDAWAQHRDYVTYSTKEIKTKESYESFAELYQTIQSKLFNIDEVLDHIINTTV